MVICCSVWNRKKGHPMSNGVQVLNLTTTFEPSIERSSRERVIKRLSPPLPLSFTRAVIKGGIELTHCMSVAIRSINVYLCLHLWQHLSPLTRCDRIYYNHSARVSRTRVCARMIQLSQDSWISLCEIYRKPYAWSTACRKAYLWLMDT